MNPSDGVMEVNVLDYRLCLLSVRKLAISKFTHALLDILFLKSIRDKKDYGFVSVTETNEDYSIICEESCVSILEQCEHIHGVDLHNVGEIWIPLIVNVGAVGVSAAGISKIAKTVIIPLADFGVSVYCLSTYKQDYVMVREKDLQRSCEILAHDFKITKELTLDSQEIPIDPQRIPARSKEIKSREITHSYTSPKNIFHITSMDAGRVSEHALAIIDCLFYSEMVRQTADDEESFFSISIVDNDISMVLDSHMVPRFPPNVLFNTNESWRMIKIGDMPQGLGFVTAGVVAQMSDPIASAQIAEYYISSYYYGHTLVPLEEIDVVLKILSERKRKADSAQADTVQVDTLKNGK